MLLLLQQLSLRWESWHSAAAAEVCYFCCCWQTFQKVCLLCLFRQLQFAWAIVARVEVAGAGGQSALRFRLQRLPLQQLLP